MLDGEIVALDERGIPRFQLLQNRLKGKPGWGRGRSGRVHSNRAPSDKAGESGEGAIVFYAFDMPYCEGRDLTACTLDRAKVPARKGPSSPGAETGPG